MSDVWRDFDPSAGIPSDLVLNVGYTELSDEYLLEDAPSSDTEIDVQSDSLFDDESELDEDNNDDELGVPASLSIVSQTVRTGPDGNQVVDIVVDVEEVFGAVNYDIRITK